MDDIKKPTRFERLARIDKEIQRIHKTIYPDKCEEVRELILNALHERKEAIIDGRV